jgi:hypothetical protein
VQVLKIGVRIGVEAVVDPMETFKGEKVLVKKEDVKKAIEKLMAWKENREEAELKYKILLIRLLKMVDLLIQIANCLYKKL